MIASARRMLIGVSSVPHFDAYRRRNVEQIHHTLPGTKKEVDMLRLAKNLSGFTLGAIDGEIGKVKEFYFDDRTWTIRYLVADTGKWLSDRSVLISPYALSDIQTEETIIHVNLTKVQIENSPAIETNRPVSRQDELLYYPYYGYPSYWGGSSLWGNAAYPQMLELPPGMEARRAAASKHEDDDPHLRSSQDVDGHSIQALDGDVGHVVDLVIDDESWVIRYLIVATRNWLPGKKVLIGTRSVQHISWEESKVYLQLKRETIENSPEYSEELLLSRDYEAKLHRHYDLEEYWQQELAHTHTR
jgi:hypothetical protein